MSGPGLLATPPGDCIHVNVPGVTLDLGSATISSSPTAIADIGVWVLSTAAGAVVKGALNAPATVTGFTTGIQIDAPSATLENLVAQNNSVGIRITGGSAYGSALAVHNSSLTGILISGPAPGPYLTGVSVDSTRGFAGIELNGVHGAFLTNLTTPISASREKAACLRGFLALRPPYAADYAAYGLQTRHFGPAERPRHWPRRSRRPPDFEPRSHGSAGGRGVKVWLDRRGNRRLPVREIFVEKSGARTTELVPGRSVR